MTDEQTSPEATTRPEPPPLAQYVTPPPVSPPPDAPSPPLPPAPTAKPASKLRTYLSIGVLVAILAVVLWVVKDNVSADDLKSGDCFNSPSGSSVSTVEHKACTEAHEGEVFHVVEYTGDTYPISLSLESFIESSCVPAFATYVGAGLDTRIDLAIGYFYPSRDGWDDGDRTITCYLANDDESPLTKPVKGTGSGT